MSNAARSAETGELIVARLGLEMARRTCDLCEMHPGEAEGLTPRRRPAVGGSSSYADVPGAEPYAEWVLSARRGLLAMAEEHAGETIGAVTNAAVIMASLEIFANMPRVSATAAPPVANTPITEWALGLSVPWAAGSEPSWAVSRHNDAAHLHLSEHQKSISPGA